MRPGDSWSCRAAYEVDDPLRRSAFSDPLRPAPAFKDVLFIQDIVQVMVPLRRRASRPQLFRAPFLGRGLAAVLRRETRAAAQVRTTRTKHVTAGVFELTLRLGDASGENLAHLQDERAVLGCVVPQAAPAFSAQLRSVSWTQLAGVPLYSRWDVVPASSCNQVNQLHQHRCIENSAGLFFTKASGQVYTTRPGEQTISQL